VAENNVLNFRN